VRREGDRDGRRARLVVGTGQRREARDGDDVAAAQIVRSRSGDRGHTTRIPEERRTVLLREHRGRGHRHLRGQGQPQVVVPGGVGRCASGGQGVVADLGHPVTGVVEPLLVGFRGGQRGDVDVGRPGQPLEVVDVARVAQSVERLDRAGAVRVVHDDRLRVGDQVTRVQLAVAGDLRRVVRQQLRGDLGGQPHER
jgi:hypothetical protein